MKKINEGKRRNEGQTNIRKDDFRTVLFDMQCQNVSISIFIKEKNKNNIKEIEENVLNLF